MRTLKLRVAASILCCLIAGLILILFNNFTLLTGWDFKGRAMQDSAPVGSITMSVNAKLESYYLPGTRLRIYAKSKQPCDLNVRIHSTNEKALSAALERLSIRTGNRTTELVRPNDNLMWPFEERSYPTWDGNAMVLSKSLVAEGMITNCLSRNLPVIVECSVILKDSEGAETRMSNVWTFLPKKLCGFVPSYYLDSLNGGPPSGYPGP